MECHTGLKVQPQPKETVLPCPATSKSRKRPAIDTELCQALQRKDRGELAESLAREAPFRETNRKSVGILRGGPRRRSTPKNGRTKNNAAPQPQADAASIEGQQPGRILAGTSYFCGASSVTHGQKFCGL